MVTFAEALDKPIKFKLCPYCRMPLGRARIKGRHRKCYRTTYGKAAARKANRK